MNKVFSSFSESFGILKKDKWIIFFSLIPISIGLSIYYYLGAWLYGDVLKRGQEIIQGQISSDSWVNVLSYLIIGVLTVLLYFIISWTFVMLVSLISSPFNDIISQRAERHIREQQQENVGISIKRVFSKILFILVNEIKKIIFIVILTILGIIFSFVIPPLSVVVSALLLSMSFVDYTWSRNELTFSKCFKDIRSSFLSYSVAGGIFLALVAIPLLNLFALPYGIIYFTVLHTRLNEVEKIHEKNISTST